MCVTVQEEMCLVKIIILLKLDDMEEEIRRYIWFASSASEQEVGDDAVNAYFSRRALEILKVKTQSHPHGGF